MTWVAANPNTFMPAGLSGGLSAASDAITAYIKTLQDGLAFARLYQKNFHTSAPDAATAIVKALIDTIEGLLQTGKIHVLFIPMAKVFAQAPGDNSNVPPTLNDVATALGFSFAEAGLVVTKDATQAYARLAGGRGGNKGFFNTFLSSLTDLLDANRPAYDSPKDAVVMGVALAGAQSFAQTVEMAASFNRIFKPAGNADLTARTIPNPQNLTTKIIALPQSQQMGVRLEWDAPKNIYVLPFFPGVSVKVSRYAVIRSTSNRAMSAKNVSDLFATRDLTVGLTSPDAAKAHTVVGIGSGSNTTFVDDATLDRLKTYYYHVAWEVVVTEKGVATTIKFDKLSNVAKTKTSAPYLSQNSVPPDWAAYGSLLDIVPDVSQQIKVLLEQLRAISERQIGAAAQINATVDLMNVQLVDSLAHLDELNTAVKRFTAVLAEPFPSLHSTTFSGVGGNAFLISELAKRLQDTSDSNRPPFDDSEYVMGMCIVGGGPRMADIQPVVDFLNSLFGTPNADNPLLGILNVIDTVVTAQETKFGQNMTATTETVDPLTGLPVRAETPALSEDGLPVQTNDPANPDAGFTNIVPLSDLC